LKIVIRSCKGARFANRLWASGKWVTILFQAAASNRQGSMLWRIKVPFPDLAFNT
jgi:hypothetical protein